MDWVGRGVAKNTDKYITYGTAEKKQQKMCQSFHMMMMGRVPAFKSSLVQVNAVYPVFSHLFDFTPLCTK